MFEMDFQTYLAQNGPPAPPGERTLTGEPGGGDREGSSGGLFGGGDGGFFFMILLAMIVFMIMMTVMGNRREKKKRNEMLSTLRKHDKVQTIGGVIGSIIEIKPEQVVLKVDESSNTRITFARSAIQQVIKSSSAKDSGQRSEEDDGAETEERAA